MSKKERMMEMKKLFILLLAQTLFLTNVKAEEYGAWAEVDENMKKGAITEERYRFYKEEKVGEYLQNLDELEKNYQYKDKFDIKYLDYSNWYEECNVDTNIYNIEYKTTNAYQSVIPIRFLVLNNFSKDTSITKINIYNNDKLTDYEVLSCATCSNNLEKIGKNNIVKLYFNEEIEVKNLKIEIEFIDKDINYQITFSNDAQLNKISLQKEVSSNDTNFIFDKTWLNNSTYSNIFYTLEPINIDLFTKSLGTKEMCRYQKYLFFNYNLNKVYYDDNYYTDVDGYIKDKNDYKTYYKNKINETTTSVVTTSNEVSNELSNEDETKEEIKEDNKEIKEEISKDKKNTSTKNVSEKLEDKTDTKLVKTLSISNNKSIVKYIILIVIGLTLIYIIYSNRKYIIKK